MSKIDGLMTSFNRLGLGGENGVTLQPGWLDVVEDALAEHGYYLAPIVPAETVGARTTDPRTSKAAVPSRTRAGSQRHLLLQSYALPEADSNGLTDEGAMELAEGVSPFSEYATRCSELRRAGLIRDTGEDRKGATGTPRIVCVITEMGKAELRRLGS